MSDDLLQRYLQPASHGYTRVAVAVPHVRIADPAANAAATIALYEEAAAAGAALVAFPELGLAAYTCDDLFHQHALLDGCEAALRDIARATAGRGTVAIVGLPFRVDHALYNCAAVVADGRVRGLVPKTYLPNYGEFYEGRQFTPALHAHRRHVGIDGEPVPFGNDLLFRVERPRSWCFHVEICEDLWVPLPPSTLAALAGATVLVNLSASNITVGKSAYRHQLVGQHAARNIAACLYSSAGLGESTTDLAWDGQSLIYEGGERLAESPRFSMQAHWIAADVDLERLSHDRMRQTSFGACAARHRDELTKLRTVELEGAGAVATGALRRRVERFPYVPADPALRDERCREVYDIQVQALVQRMQASGQKRLVIGISGGLDSTHALLVCAQAMDLLGLPRYDILAYTMPGYATGTRTLDQALRLMTAIGCKAETIDIRPSCDQMLRDLRHAAADGEALYDVTFENVQAGERTSHLFRLANQHHAIVVGTGDLSELALGWCTYGVGDQMSHYHVNASVPKTLIRYLVRWVSEQAWVDDDGRRVLREILDTEVSPELVPAAPGAADANDQPAQSTEAKLGPYALHDFFLYYTVRFGLAPEKIAFLAWTAWHDRNAGRWPDAVDLATAERPQYALSDIRRHLATFADRFFRLSQFKRSAMPNAPKVGSGGSLSPRGDWRAPSDGRADLWLAAVERIPGG